MDHNDKDQKETELKQIPINDETTNKNQINNSKYLDYFYGKSKFIYDNQLVENLLDHSVLLKRLTSDALQRILGKQQKYTYLKKLAIERLEVMIWRQLNVLFNLNYSYDDPEESLAHKIFDWSLEEFLNRRKLENFVWIDVLLKFPDICLHKYKFRKDLEQLKKYMEYIFDSLFVGDEKEKIDIDSYVVKPISNIKQLLKTCHHMEQEFQNNKNHLNEIMQSELVLTNTKRDTEKRLTAIFLHTKITNSHIWDPIEKRYCLKWYRSNVNQNQYRNDIIQQNYERGINNYMSRTFLENACSNNCMDYCYSAIEHLKTTINEIQLKFDTALEEMENNLSYKRLQIDKLRDQRRWLSKEIKRFHDEIEEMRIRQEREAEERERLRLEKEEEEETQIIEKNEIKGKKEKKFIR